jgi:hypothetical protein
MSKQSAVEWLQEQLQKGVDFNPLDKNSYLNNVEKIFNHAKAMEREQIIDAYNNGDLRSADLYYNETYGGDK